MSTGFDFGSNWLKLFSVLLCALVLQACVLTGNTGPITIKCETEAGAKFELTLPMGSGREYNDGIQTSEGHACGPIVIPSIEQGEDRSGGLMGILRGIFVGQ